MDNSIKKAMSYSCTSFLFQGLQIYGIVKECDNALEQEKFGCDFYHSVHCLNNIVYFGNFSSEDGWFWPRL